MMQYTARAALQAWWQAEVATLCQEIEETPIAGLTLDPCASVWGPLQWHGQTETPC